MARKEQSQSFLDLWPELRAWYRKGARDFPWRKTPVDPYKVWICEVMSQQSTMAMMLPYFEKWMELFPSLKALAGAKEEEVLKAWAGLGYYSRARNIHKSAQILHNEWRVGAKGWPSDPKKLQELPGVGSYTAAAIASIALGEKALALDGNVYRVGARFFGVKDPLNTKKDRDKIEQAFEEVIEGIPKSSASIFTQALMELGAIVCRPAEQAMCELCPLEEECIAQKKNKVAQWPLKKKRKEFNEHFLLARIFPSALPLQKIPEGERLAGQWELPLTKLSTKEEFEKRKSSKGFVGECRHTITNNKYRVGIELLSQKPKLQKGQSWAKEADFEGRGRHLTTLSRKILKKLPKN